MAAGFRVYQKINRADKTIVEGFREISVSNIVDTMQKITGAHSGIKPFNNVKLLGTAFTVKTPMGDNLMFHQALSMAEPGDVIVVDGNGCTERAICGENMMLIAKKRGVRGFLIDGSIRDIQAAANLDNFAVFARGVQAIASYKGLGPGEIGLPVSVGGMVVCPGDVVVGDGDGVVAIRPRDAGEILRLSKALADKEQDTVRQIEDGTIDRGWVMKALREKGCEFIDAAWEEKGE
ncbi:methyltransferase [Synergistales bacterium]|nr:methyltransferase [Synergistales bacterium]